MYAVTEPRVEALPVEPHAGNEVSCAFVQESPTVWIGTARCKHGAGADEPRTCSAPGVPSLNPTQMVTGTYRQHALMVGCDCPQQRTQAQRHDDLRHVRGRHAR